MEDISQKSPYLKACELWRSDVAFNPRSVMWYPPGHLYLQDLARPHWCPSNETCTLCVE